MNENENPELANAYFIQGDKYYENQNFEAALNNYLQGFNFTENIPTQIKLNAGLCFFYLEDNIKCLQTLSLISIAELGVLNDFDLKNMFYYLAQTLHNLEYEEAALNIVNFNLRIKADISIEFQALILEEKMVILACLGLSEEGKMCADELISLVNSSITSSEFLESRLAMAFMEKAIFNKLEGNNQSALQYLNDGKIHASKSDDKSNLTKLISNLENDFNQK